MTLVKINQPKIKDNITRLEFLNKFTDEELVAIYTAAKSNISVEIMMDKVKAAEYISLTDEKTISGVTMLETVGLITEGRAQEILDS